MSCHLCRSVKSFAEEFKKRGQPLHVLLNNGGDFSPPNATTEDGFEYLTGVNYMVSTAPVSSSTCLVLTKKLKFKHIMTGAAQYVVDCRLPPLSEI